MQIAPFVFDILRADLDPHQFVMAASNEHKPTLGITSRARDAAVPHWEPSMGYSFQRSLRMAYPPNTVLDPGDLERLAKGSPRGAGSVRVPRLMFRRNSSRKSAMTRGMNEDPIIGAVSTVAR